MLVVQTEARPAKAAPPPLIAKHPRGDKNVSVEAIQAEFSGRESFIIAMYDHASTCTTELSWHEWKREAFAVARGYPDAPTGPELGKYGAIKDQICSSVFPESYALRMAQRQKREKGRGTGAHR